MITKDYNDTNDSELIMLYHENDEDAKNILFLKYKFIIDILIKKYYKYISLLNIDMQEVYSESTVAFTDAINNYKDNKEASLPTFITLCVERRINRIIKKYNQDKYKILKESYSLDFAYDNLGRPLIDILSDDSKKDPLKSLEEEEKTKELIEKIREVLSPKENEVFSLMARNLNYMEIAKILDCNPKQIDNAEQRIKIKVKKVLSENG